MILSNWQFNATFVAGLLFAGNVFAQEPQPSAQVPVEETLVTVPNPVEGQATAPVDPTQPEPGTPLVPAAEQVELALPEPSASLVPRADSAASAQTAAEEAALAAELDEASRQAST